MTETSAPAPAATREDEVVQIDTSSKPSLADLSTQQEVKKESAAMQAIRARRQALIAKKSVQAQPQIHIRPPQQETVVLQAKIEPAPVLVEEVKTEVIPAEQILRKRQRGQNEDEGQQLLTMQQQSLKRQQTYQAQKANGPPGLHSQVQSMWIKHSKWSSRFRHK